LSSANNIIKFLIDFIKQNNIKKIIDGSCGDCNWIMEVLKFFPDIEFIGNDVSTTIIHQNKETFANTHYSFYVKNAIEDEIENCDLFIFRHKIFIILQIEN
jgi:trans-aconitate methyltransferase